MLSDHRPLLNVSFDFSSYFFSALQVYKSKLVPMQIQTICIRETTGLNNSVISLPLL